MMLCRECDNSRSLESGQRIAKDIDCLGALGSGRGKGDIKSLGCGRLDDRQSQAQVPGRPGYLLG
jgi:hypothetical protein